MRVESVDASKQRLSLSLVAGKAGAGLEAEAATPDPLGALQPGDLVRGTVAQVQRKQVRPPPLPSAPLTFYTQRSIASSCSNT